MFQTKTTFTDKPQVIEVCYLDWKVELSGKGVFELWKFGYIVRYNDKKGKLKVTSDGCEISQFPGRSRVKVTLLPRLLDIPIIDMRHADVNPMDIAYCRDDYDQLIQHLGRSESWKHSRRFGQ
jgi:hypothetical protein